MTYHFTRRQKAGSLSYSISATKENPGRSTNSWLGSYTSISRSTRTLAKETCLVHGTIIQGRGVPMPLAIEKI